MKDNCEFCGIDIGNCPHVIALERLIRKLKDALQEVVGVCEDKYAEKNMINNIYLRILIEERP